MKLVFFGSGAFGLPSLQALRDRHEILSIVSQPDRPSGRKRKLTPTPVAQWALDHAPDIPLERPENVNEPEILARLRAHAADAWVVIAYGQKLSDALYADRFTINLHASLLPRWRGAAPINHAIIAGDAVTGNSVIAVAPRMDAGAVYAQSERPIEHSQTAGQLHDALAEDGPDLLLSVLEQHQRGQTEPTEQDESRVTLASKLAKSDGWVRFADGADACRRRINGLSPWPGVTIEIDGTTLKVLSAKSRDADGEQREGKPGTLVEDSASAAIACGTAESPSLLVPLRVQAPGKREAAWDEFLRGRRIGPGAIADDRSGGDGPC